MQLSGERRCSTRQQGPCFQALKAGGAIYTRPCTVPAHRCTRHSHRLCIIIPMQQSDHLVMIACAADNISLLVFDNVVRLKTPQNYRDGQSRSVVAANAVTTGSSRATTSRLLPANKAFTSSEGAASILTQRYRSQPLVQDHRPPRRYVASSGMGVMGWFA
jgi:hypothetical protein